MNTLIVSGGEISLAFLKEYYIRQNPKLIIAVDKGLEALSKLNLTPHHIVGDLDSIDSNILNLYQNSSHITLHQYNPKKDYTDTDIALNLAIELGSSNITILGALGKRMDHALGNIHILTNTLKSHIPCEILDANNRIYLIDNTHTIKKKEAYGKYISLIPLTSFVKGLTLTGFKYPLTASHLTIGKSLGISNEIISSYATIDLKQGILIVIESKD
ncbi:MAG: thiamine diphosphokinase [Clostridia bacterium]|nr:thiamine diphosphokinase [Clostridia bacterium]